MPGKKGGWRTDHPLGPIRVPHPSILRVRVLTFPRLPATHFCPIPASTCRQTTYSYHLTIGTDLL